MFLEITDASVRYASPNLLPSAARAAARPAVDRVSLGLAPGELGVLIGPSGCGKTSLLRAVAGLEPLAEGRIAIDGDVLSDAASGRHVPPEARRIGMVFQDYALFPHLDVAANVAFGIRHLPAPRRRERVLAALELVGLQHAGSRAPHQLSGGQQQRVALARALAPGPRLMLLDEPFSSLDADLRERLAQELRGILKAAGTTALFVTHDQLEAFAVGDRIGVMQGGRLEQWDAPYALYHRPATRFVAGFIGDSVFTEARLLPGEGSGPPRLRTALGDLSPPPGAPLPAAGPDGRIDLLLRADDVVHDDAAPLKARVERKSFHGASFLYALRLPGGEPLLAHVPSHHDHAIGEWIGIRAELDHLVAFPVEHPGQQAGQGRAEPPAPAATEPG